MSPNVAHQQRGPHTSSIRPSTQTTMWLYNLLPLLVNQALSTKWPQQETSNQFMR